MQLVQGLTTITFAILMGVLSAKAQTKQELLVCEAADADVEDVIAACTVVIESKKLSGRSFASMLSSRCYAYTKNRDFDKALADCNQAIKTDGNYSVAYLSRGLVYAAAKNFDSAIADYEQALILNPKSSLAYNYRGNVYRLKGDIERAIADFTKALQIDPADRLAIENRADAYEAKGDINLATAERGRSLRLAPGHAAASDKCAALLHEYNKPHVESPKIQSWKSGYRAVRCDYWKKYSSELEANKPLRLQLDENCPAEYHKDKYDTPQYFLYVDRAKQRATKECEKADIERRGEALLVEAEAAELLARRDPTVDNWSTARNRYRAAYEEFNKNSDDFEKRILAKLNAQRIDRIISPLAPDPKTCSRQTELLKSFAKDGIDVAVLQADLEVHCK